MEEKHFFVVHTFVSDEARKEYLIPPEKRNPPKKSRQNENGLKQQQVNLLGVSRDGVEMKSFSIVIGLQQVNVMFTDNLMNLTLETSF